MMREAPGIYSCRADAEAHLREVIHDFAQARFLALDRNLGFGGGSNAGFRAAKNDVVVLLNSDMRVAPDFLQPLLEGFGDPGVFAVSCDAKSCKNSGPLRNSLR